MTFPEQYERHWLKGMRAKLGLVSEDEADLDLATGFLTAMEGQESRLHVGFPLPRRRGLRPRKNRFARCLPMRRPMISGVNTGGRGLRASR